MYRKHVCLVVVVVVVVVDQWCWLCVCVWGGGGGSVTVLARIDSYPKNSCPVPVLTLGPKQC